MKRQEFCKCFGYLTIGIPLAATSLVSCGSLYYAAFELQNRIIAVKKSEFIRSGNDGDKKRAFVLVRPENFPVPICLHWNTGDGFTANLLKCTHRDCELNVGGGIYSCPCHGSEFSYGGEVLQGPATQNLKSFLTTSDVENVYIHLV